MLLQKETVGVVIALGLFWFIDLKKEKNNDTH
jgi:hypothetical protein